MSATSGESVHPISTVHEDGGLPFTLDLLRRAYLVSVDGHVKVRLATLHGQTPLTWEYDFAQFKERVMLGWSESERQADALRRSLEDLVALADTLDAKRVATSGGSGADR